MADKYSAAQLDDLKAKGHTFPGTTSYPIDDEEDLVNAVRAVGRGQVAGHDEIRKYIVGRAKAMGLDSKIPDDWNADGTLKDAPRSEFDSAVTARNVERFYEFQDISIRADGTGRTVVAYAAPFDKSYEVNDQDGHYNESIERSAFDKSIAEQSKRVQCFYNHGMTLFRTPSERFAVPLGMPKEIRADGRGLLTVTEYNRTPLADEVLESIRNGEMRAQSWSGRMVRSQRSRGYGGALPTITRSEIALREYGPTPIPTSWDAAIVGVRSSHMLVDDLADTLRGLPAEDRREVIRLSDTSLTGTPSSTADDAAHTGTSSANGTPGDTHLPGPTQDQRQRRLRALQLAIPKGH